MNAIPMKWENASIHEDTLKRLKSYSRCIPIDLAQEYGSEATKVWNAATRSKSWRFLGIIRLRQAPNKLSYAAVSQPMGAILKAVATGFHRTKEGEMQLLLLPLDNKPITSLEVAATVEEFVRGQ